MTVTMNTNGKIRKSLAEQIDRLDGILDGLADGLQDAIKQAVGSAVKEAVRTVLAEVLTNNELLANLKGEAAASIPTETVAPVPTRPTLKQRVAKIASWVSS